MCCKYDAIVLSVVFVITLVCGYAHGQTGDDRDNDDLPDATEALIGTDPDNPDSDGDGLWDGWEHTNGIPALGITISGANPSVKDVFVEIDRFDSVAQTPEELRNLKAELAKVVAAFAAHGITLHLEWDQDDIPTEADLSYSSWLALGYGRWQELWEIHFESKKRLTHRHALLVNSFSEPDELGRGTYPEVGQYLVVKAQPLNQIAGVFMHELGHTLGLSHGGLYRDSGLGRRVPIARIRRDHKKHKPNHLSVMNPAFLLGIPNSNPPMLRLDYQDTDIEYDLNEWYVDEGKGLNIPGPPVSGKRTKRSYGNDNYSMTFPVEGPINWNEQGASDEVLRFENLNGDTWITRLRGTLSEWDKLIFQAGQIGSLALYRTHLIIGTGTSTSQVYFPTHAIIDSYALARDPANNFQSTGVVIPIGTNVRLIESRTHSGRVYVKIQEVLPIGAAGPSATWWTADSNLGSIKEVDLTMFPQRQIDVSALRELERSMATIHNTKGRYIERQATRLRVSAADLAAVLFVESGGKGFNSDGTPIIRFENHKFDEYWGRDPDNPENQAAFNNHFRYNRLGEPWKDHEFREATTGAWESSTQTQTYYYRVLRFARAISQQYSPGDNSSDEPALKSISFGMGQIMGFNHRDAGYYSARELYDNFSRSIRVQLDGVIAFIENNRGGACLRALRNGDYFRFAEIYNGSGQATIYSTRIRNAAQAYDRVVP